MSFKFLAFSREQMTHSMLSYSGAWEAIHHQTWRKNCLVYTDWYQAWHVITYLEMYLSRSLAHHSLYSSRSFALWCTCHRPGTNSTNSPNRSECYIIANSVVLNPSKINVSFLYTYSWGVCQQLSCDLCRRHSGVMIFLIATWGGIIVSRHYMTYFVGLGFVDYTCETPVLTAHTIRLTVELMCRRYRIDCNVTQSSTFAHCRAEFHCGHSAKILLWWYRSNRRYGWNLQIQGRRIVRCAPNDS